MKNYMKLFLIVIIAVSALLITGCSSKESGENVHNEHSEELYTCGMHPNVVQEGPGTCPICGMYLTPLNASPDEQSDGSIKIDAVTAQNMGVRTATIERRDIVQHIRALGRVEYDESQSGLIQTKYSGWVEKVYFSRTGDTVNKGDVLLEIYSPKLVAAQQEYLELLANSTINENVNANLTAARKRLENFDISEDQIEYLENTGTVSRTIEIASPFDGIIENKHVENGMEVKPNMKLYSVSNLDNIWVVADIYESDAPHIKIGLTAEMKLDYLPGAVFNGVIEHVYPYLDSKIRALKVRLAFSNKDEILKPGMYANVNIHTEPISNALAAPVESVIFSGNDNLVFIDKGDGQFAPRNVVIGTESHDGYYEIKEGLDAGEIVVTSAQFLLDSESKLQKNIAGMGSKASKKDHSQHNH